MESDLKVTVMVNEKSHFDYTVHWQDDEVINTAEMPVPAEEIKRLEIKVGRCICKKVECPVHGEVNQKRGAEGV